MQVIETGNTKIVGYLVDNFCNIIDLDEALIHASIHSHKWILSILLQAGARVEYRGHLAMIHSSGNEDDPSKVKELLHYGGNPNAGNFPTMSFVCNGCIPGVKLLLDYGAVLNNPEYDLLEIACEEDRGSLEMMKFLLDRGINITPDSIKSAIDSGSVSRVKMLFDYNPDLVIGEPDLIVAVSKILEKTE